MKLLGRGCFKMPCENCALQFSVFRRKRACSECERFYCNDCLRRGGGTMCGPCRILSTRPLLRQTISHLKVRDLQYFLQRQNVSTRGCVEKEELVSLCVTHVNSAAYRRRGPRTQGPFSTLKGLTNNINELINTAFDIRNPNRPAPRPTRSNCFNSSHVHVNRSAPRYPQGNNTNTSSQFTTRPGGEPDIVVPVPEPESPHSDSSEAARVETNDCYEVEDVDESGWEFVTRPADPLPNDSETLITAAQSSEPTAPYSPLRSSSELELARSPPSPLSAPGASSTSGSAETIGIREELPATADDDRQRPRQRASSEQDLHYDPPTGSPHLITLEQMKRVSELELLSVKQLKELLTRNRVDYRGCVERRDLLERAKLLWKDHVKFKNEIENLPLEECCKICMAAPLECVLLECGHIAACTACSKQLAECPICRQYIVRAVRFFRS